MLEIPDDQLTVFLGYAGDAAAEAKRVVDLTAALGAELARLREVQPALPRHTVKVWSWERDQDGRPGGQARIDPVIDRADLAVFVFRGKVGTVTRDEVERARTRASDLPVYALFPAHPPPEARSTEGARAWADLLDYREALVRDAGWSALGTRSLRPLDRYDSPEHLAQVVLAQYHVDLGWICARALRVAQTKPSRRRRDDAAVERLLAHMRARHGGIELKGLGGGDIRLPLDDVFVPLRLERRSEPGLAGHGAGGEADGQTELTVEQVFGKTQAGRPHVAIFGRPGAGKTTALRKLLLRCLEGGGALEGVGAAALPVLAPLRRFAREDLDQPLGAFLGRVLALESEQPSGQESVQHPRQGVDARDIENLWQRGDLLVLLDGLDEVGDDQLRRDLCPYLESELAAAAGRGVRAAISCRDAFRQHVELEGCCTAVEVRPLDAAQCRRLVEQWFAAADGRVPDLPRSELRQRAKRLLDALDRGDYASSQLRRAVSTPLLLTLLCVVVLRQGEMPKHRVSFYDRCLDVLLRQWRYAQHEQEPPVDADAARAVLRRVAFELHTAGRRDDLRHLQFMRLAGEVLRRRDAGANPARVLTWLHREAAVLEEYAPRQFGFMHQGVQEYLCAAEIARRGDEEVRALAGRAGDDRWREVTLLHVGLRDQQCFGPWCRALLEGDWLRHVELLRDALADAHEPDLAPLLERLTATRSREERAALLRLLQHRPESEIEPAARGLQDDRDDTVRGLARAIVAAAARRRQGDGARPLLVVAGEADRVAALRVVAALGEGGAGVRYDALDEGAAPWLEDLERVFDECRQVLVLRGGADPWDDCETRGALEVLAEHGCAVWTAALAGAPAREAAPLGRSVEPDGAGEAAIARALIGGASAPAAARAAADVRDAAAKTGPLRGARLELPCGDAPALVLLGVPAGTFDMGGEVIVNGEAWQASLPVHRVQVSAFWLAETPVTNRAYAAFLAAEPGVREPACWRDDRFSAPEQPVVGVSWDEAMTYCAWLQRSARLPAGWRVALPSEAQWEFAARREDGRAFPWGDKEPAAARACYARNWSHGKPDEVGAHPSGRGPFGHLDLAGLVWEWCADAWQEDAYVQRAAPAPVRDPLYDVTGAPGRALRGGAWVSSAEFLRAAFRVSDDARYRYDYIGFRVAVIPAHTASA